MDKGMKFHWANGLKNTELAMVIVTAQSSADRSSIRLGNEWLLVRVSPSLCVPEPDTGAAAHLLLSTGSTDER